MISIAQPFISKKERKVADKVLVSGMIAQGSKVVEFEKIEDKIRV